MHLGDDDIVSEHDDIALLIGEEDDWDATPELGIDYGTSDPNVVKHMEQCASDPPKVRLNPGSRHKLIRKRIASVNYDKPSRVLSVTFTDGCSLTIGE